MDYVYEYGEEEKKNVELMLTSIGREDCRPGHAFGPGERNTYLIRYVLRGCGIFRLGGRTYRVGAGEAFLICPKELVYYEADEKTPWSYAWIGFSGAKAAETIRQTILPERRVFRYHSAALYRCHERLLEAMQAGAGRELLLASILYEYLYLLLQQYAQPDKRVSRREDENYYVGKIKAYIESSYAEGIKVGKIAAFFKMDRSYLFRLFKQETGVSLQEYLIAFRMKKACDLLRGTAYPIGAVGRSVGYPDPLYFTRVFHKRFGMSPSAYRRARKKEGAGDDFSER